MKYLTAFTLMALAVLLFVGIFGLQMAIYFLGTLVILSLLVMAGVILFS